MAFRERLIWIQLCATLIVYGAYFWQAGPALAAGNAGAIALLFVPFTIVLVILIAVPSIVLAAWKPADARQAEDERERLVRLRATAWGQPILVTAVWIVAGAGIVLDLNALQIAHLALASVLVSEIAVWSIQLIMLRRPA